MRDLARVRAAVLADRKRAQQRLTAMLMRHGQVWRSRYWTGPHRTWIAAQSFDEPALTTALAHYRATLGTQETELACIESGLAPWARREPLAPAVRRLCCYRGIAELTALTLAAEVAGWRRSGSARAFMGYTGLVPCECSGGQRTWRGHTSVPSITSRAPANGPRWRGPRRRAFGFAGRGAGPRDQRAWRTGS